MISVIDIWISLLIIYILHLCYAKLQPTHRKLLGVACSLVQCATTTGLLARGCNVEQHPDAFELVWADALELRCS